MIIFLVVFSKNRAKEVPQARKINRIDMVIISV